MASNIWEQRAVSGVATNTASLAEMAQEQVEVVANRLLAIENWKLELVNLYGTDSFIGFTAAGGALTVDYGDVPVVRDMSQVATSVSMLQRSRFNLLSGHNYLWCIKVKCTSYGTHGDANVSLAVDGAYSGVASMFAVASYYSTHYNEHDAISVVYLQADSSLLANTYQCLGGLLSVTADGVVQINFALNEGDKTAIYEYKELILVDITDKYTTDTVGAIINTSYFATTKTIYRHQNVNVLYNGSQKGKTILFAGDSITEGQRVTLDAETLIKPTYGALVAQRNNMIYYNFARQGWMMLHKDGYTNAFSDVNGLYTQLPDNLDYIILPYGYNDWGQYGTVGTISDADNTTFYGAWNVVLSYLISEYPMAKIGLIVPYGTTASYRQAVRDVSQKYGLKCLDLYSDSVPMIYERESASGVPSAISDVRKATFLDVDGVHLNDDGQEYLSTIIEDFVKSL